MYKGKGIAAMLLASVAAFSSCSKDDDNTNSNTSGGNASVEMRLTDAPAEYDAVYLDIQKIEVTMEGQSATQVAVARPGIYNLLNFRDGRDTFLTETQFPAGKISQIRLILGENNSVVVNGSRYALNTPSAQESGVKLNLNQTLEANKSYTYYIDFDAGKSIHETGNGKYQLKPVIRAYSVLTNGKISGVVVPAASLTTVYAINGTDTFSAVPNTSGGFVISGLPEGKYNVWFDAAGIGYQDKTKTDVQVTYGTNVDLGTTIIEL